MINEISKHDPHAYEGKMCRLTFSRIMNSLIEFICEISPTNQDEDKENERLFKIMMRDQLDQVIKKIEQKHEYFLYDEPKESPEYAELKPQEETPEWKKQHELPL
jgi:hypothetical protein